jgi:hypothetical protein
LFLDPQNDQARYQVTELERRLHDLLAPQQQAGAQVRSVPAAAPAGPRLDPGNRDTHQS